MTYHYAVTITCPPAAADAIEFRLQARGALGTAIQDPQAYRNLPRTSDATIFYDPEGLEGFGDQAKVTGWFAMSNGRVHLHEPFKAFQEVIPSTAADDASPPEQSFSPKTTGNLLTRDLQEVAKIFDCTEEVKADFALMEEKDWAEAWKAYYRVFELSRHITVRPSWLTADETDNKRIISLDAGSAFGTGEHASTRLGARLLDDLLTTEKERAPWSILDLGCGSGILAIVAGKLGRADDSILAIDLDPQAAVTAAENIRTNALTHIRVRAGELKDVPGPYDLLIANLILNLHLEFLSEYARSVKPGGYLIVSGITKERAPEWRAALKGSSFSVLQEMTEEDWSAWILRRCSPENPGRAETYQPK